MTLFIHLFNMLVHVYARGKPRVTFLRYCPPWFLRQGLLMTRDLLIQLTIQRAPGTSPSLPPQHWDSSRHPCVWFY